MSSDKVKESEVVNFRMPRHLHVTVKALAAELNVSMSTVMLSSLLWARVPTERRNKWVDYIEAFRELVKDANFDEKIQLHEIASGDFLERDELCKHLEEIGMIDNYCCRPSVNLPGARLCTYRLTNVGRVIAHTLADHQCDSNAVDIDTPIPESVA